MSATGTSPLDELKQAFGDRALAPGDAGYDEARAIWNAMVDKRPAAIVRCASAADVARVVGIVRDRGVPLAVRGGGHNIAGLALCDDGVVVDLSGMKAVEVDAGARRATVEGGATLADVDAATQAHGLAVPLGINSTTGVGGLTLGGGFGWLSRSLGMTVDSLEWAEVVVASGEVLRASESEHADLFWALRGGGGNFGVVTRFGFRLHPVGPQLLSGLIVHPLAEAKTVLQCYREFAARAPDELSVWVVLRLAPPLPFLPAEAHGKGVVVLALLHAGDPGEGTGLIEPLRRFGSLLGEHVGVQPYVDWQQAFDPLLAPGARNYWKSHNFEHIDDGLIDAVIDAVDKLPSPECEIFFGAIGGATTAPAPDATAYAHRSTRFVMNVHARWREGADDAACIGWARDFFRAAAPYASGGVYVNFLTADEGDRVQAAYGPNHERLARVKRAYDPSNLFRVNQNIAPA